MFIVPIFNTEDGKDTVVLEKTLVPLMYMFIFVADAVDASTVTHRMKGTVSVMV